MMRKLIGLLATGDEVQQGDILNTNAQQIAHLLTDNQLHIGEHMVAGDQQPVMVRALRYLLNEHQAIIMTGGLGPTNDDRTRFALAEVLGCELIFDEAVWETIQVRMHSLGLDVPENNRQQALFPQDAIIINNPNGTAAGCKITVDDKVIYMLPGPPRECMTMIRDFVLPDLLALGWQTHLHSKRWRLFGVSESHMASWLEPLLANRPCQIGYRLDYPYLEFKVFAEDPKELESIVAELNPRFEPYFLADSYQSASMLLKTYLAQPECPALVLFDDVTRGRLAALLSTPATKAHISLLPVDADNGLTQANHTIIITLTGLDAFWQEQAEITETTFTMRIQHGDIDKTQTYTIPYRFQRTVLYAQEKAAAEILHFLKPMT